MAEGVVVGVGIKTGVFISYSRDDLDFADQLEAGLKLCGFSTSIDRHGISGGEDWKARLSGLIRDADNVVFVMSPSSAASEICRWEVTEAAGMGKRILPVICRPLGNIRAPEPLALLKYIYFYPEPKSPGSGFGTGLARLDEALKVDIEWLREHTRLLVRAHEWLVTGRAGNRLLLGPDVQAALHWAGSRPANAPEPTDLHLEYIRASEHAEGVRANAERSRLEEISNAQRARAGALAEREAAVRKLSRRTAVALTGAGTLTALSAGLAYWGTNAETRFRRERERAAQAGEEALQSAIDKEALRPDILGSLTIFALESGHGAQEGQQGSLLSQSLLNAVSNRSVSIEQAVRAARDEVLRNTRFAGTRPTIATDLNSAIYMRRHPPDRKRFAVVIGNSNYKQTSNLRWTAFDAEAWASFLNKEGFEVAIGIDATLRQMNDLLSWGLTKIAAQPRGNSHDPTVNSAATPNPLLVAYYAGHAISVNARHFLLPVDVNMKTDETIETSAIALDDFQSRALVGGGASIIIINPQPFRTLVGR